MYSGAPHRYLIYCHYHLALRRRSVSWADDPLALAEALACDSAARLETAAAREKPAALGQRRHPIPTETGRGGKKGKTGTRGRGRGPREACSCWFEKFVAAPPRQPEGERWKVLMERTSRGRLRVGGCGPGWSGSPRQGGSSGRSKEGRSGTSAGTRRTPCDGRERWGRGAEEGEGREEGGTSWTGPAPSSG